MTLLPLSREAILDPRLFSIKGSSRATLRRKLRHAEQAGVTTAEPAFLPLHEMSEDRKSVV